MVTNCRLSLPSHTILAIMHVYGAADGGNVICLCDYFMDPMCSMEQPKACVQKLATLSALEQNKSRG